MREITREITKEKYDYYESQPSVSAAIKSEMSDDIIYGYGYYGGSIYDQLYHQPGYIQVNVVLDDDAEPLPNGFSNPSIGGYSEIVALTLDISDMILKSSSCYCYACIAVYFLYEFPPLSFRILNILRLIENDEIPLHHIQKGNITTSRAIRRNNNIKITKELATTCPVCSVMNQNL